MKTNTSYKARAVHTSASASSAQAEGIAEGKTAGSSSAAPTSRRTARSYEGFLGLPVWVVLGVVWLAGAALLGSCALALWVLGSLLVHAIAGS